MYLTIFYCTRYKMATISVSLYDIYLVFKIKAQQARLGYVWFRAATKDIKERPKEFLTLFYLNWQTEPTPVALFLPVNSIISVISKRYYHCSLKEGFPEM
jgi:hypothetical protein